MPAPFAAREARVNAAAIRHLANAEGTYTPSGGPVQADPVSLIFDAAYITVNDQGVSSSSPAATVNLADVPTPGRGDGLLINGVQYTAVEVMPDGAGMAVMRLRK